MKLKQCQKQFETVLKQFCFRFISLFGQFKSQQQTTTLYSRGNLRDIAFTKVQSTQNDFL